MIRTRPRESPDERRFFDEPAEGGYVFTNTNVLDDGNSFFDPGILIG
jgi:hypothetical protein